MSPFTDDDLKRLKEELTCALRLDDKYAYPLQVSHPTLQALLARLEAAEWVCDGLENRSDTPDYMKYRLKLWRKAAGKS